MLFDIFQADIVLVEISVRYPSADITSICVDPDRSDRFFKDQTMEDISMAVDRVLGDKYLDRYLQAIGSDAINDRIKPITDAVRSFFGSVLCITK